MIPEIGDVAWVEFDPVIGTEQAGRRPALVLSDRTYHELSRRAVVCPISTRARPWAFNVPLPSGMITRYGVGRSDSNHRPSAANVQNYRTRPRCGGSGCPWPFGGAAAFRAHIVIAGSK